MANWFGNLDLAYKYTVVFVSLLALTIMAGLIKVFFDRRKMKKLVAKANEEAGQLEDQMELNQREKDEGDLFGVRAIEAGFYAGIPQSRPTSRAGSPSMSSTTLLGGFNSPKIQTNSMASSVTDLPLAHTNNRDSSTLPLESPPQRKAPPTIRLAPSEAEMTGRHNHNGDVNMNLNVPPSPVLPKPRSPTFDGSDDGNDLPRHYTPIAPQLPMPQGFQGSLMAGDHQPKSQAASLTYTDVSPSTSPLPSPGQPKAKKPSMPERSFSGESSSSTYLAYNTGSQSLPPSPPTIQEPPQTAFLPTTTYEPLHKRDHSGASSVYSEKRNSTYQSQTPAVQHERTASTGSAFNYSLAESSNRNSVALGALTNSSSLRPASTSKRESSADSSFLAPGSTYGNGKSNNDRQSTNDPRFSEFYDAYYRNSQLVKEAPKRPDYVNTEATIDEVPTPLSSPNPPQMGHQPGMAL